MNIFGKIIEKIYLSLPDNKVYQDSMTKCNNYTYYRDVIMHKYENQEVLIIYLDCDHLKLFNDKYGHEEGNHLIKNIAADLKALPNVQEICRLGGDEFLVVADINFFSPHLRSSEYPDISVHCSVGLCIKNKGEDVDHAVKVAESKMYENKKTRKAADKYKQKTNK